MKTIPIENNKKIPDKLMHKYNIQKILLLQNQHNKYNDNITYTQNMEKNELNTHKIWKQ